MRSLPEESQSKTADQTVFNNLELEATSYYVYDILHEEKISGLNEDKPLPLASITKLMTAVVSLESSPENTSVAVQSEELPIPKKKSSWRWNLSELLKLTLTNSSNAGAEAIAAAVGSQDSFDPENPKESFVNAMNKKAVELSLKSLTFFNASGLDLNTDEAGAYGGARDVALLFGYAWKKYPEIIDETARNSISVAPENGPSYLIKNTNQNIESFPGALGSKTGFTDLAPGNLVAGFELEPGWPIVISVLGSSKEGRFTDVEKLYTATRSALSSK